MNHRFLTSIGILAAVSLSTAAGQTQRPAPDTAQKKVVAKAASPAKKPAAFRTPWGDPDLQGVWNDATSTPLQRPNGLGKDILTDEEAVDFQSGLANDLTRDRRDGGPEIDVNRAYNDHWMDARRLKITADKRTSLVVDPPDGRIPPRVPLPPDREKVRVERAAANDRFNAGLPAHYTDFSLPVRCIIRTDSPPYLPTIYNNDFQIYQSPGFVVISPEMIHSARVIPLDGRPHLGKDLTQWLGDSRGHWEGDMLVVETTNFKRYPGVIFQGGNPDTYRITERFIRVDEKTLNYEFTIVDEKTWTKPWTARIPWNKIDPDEQMYEYACHEDNYDLVHFLTGARDRERRGDTK
jgi:hypothetical protein